MQTLEEVFAEGHSMVRARNPLRRVVRSDGKAYLVDAAAVPGLAIHRRIDPSMLQGEVAPAEAAEHVWEPDYDHCWCEACHDMRRLQDTACD